MARRRTDADAAPIYRKKLSVSWEAAIVMKHLFRTMTWEEIREAARSKRVVLIPVGAIEQHGPHLPVDTDNVAAATVCQLAAQKEPSLLVCMPTIHYGYNEHNMDFPGTISIEPEHFIQYCLDVVKSLAHHGFEHILLVNGHGSNAHLLETVARLGTVRTQAKCATLSYYSLISDWFSTIRESPFPGGANHACEFETSIYLYLKPDLVLKDKMVRELRQHTKYFWEDLMGASPVKFNDWRSRQTVTGTGGDPTLATAEKGHKIVEAAANAIVDVAEEFKSLDFGERKNLRTP